MDQWVGMIHLNIGIKLTLINNMWHVVPISDIKPHIPESCCECEPDVEILENGEIMIVHDKFEDSGQEWVALEGDFE